MSAEVIRFWEGPHAERIRITGPGEDKFDAKIIILPVVRIERHAEPKRAPRGKRK